MQKIIITGNVGSEGKVTGETLMFSVAVSESYKNKQGEKVTETEWFNCVKFKGANLAPYIKKGLKLLVEGKIKTNEKDGKKFSSLIVQQIEFLTPKEKTSSNPVSDIPDLPEDDENLPF